MSIRSGHDQAAWYPTLERFEAMADQSALLLELADGVLVAMLQGQINEIHLARLIDKTSGYLA